MNKNQLIFLHQKICDQARNLMIKKNSDYTSGSEDIFANFRTSEVFGIQAEIGMLIRLMDKLKRIESFIKKGSYEVFDESINDTTIDIINYSILILAKIKENKNI